MTTGIPESVGFSSERLKRIDALMKQYVDEGKLAGIVTTVGRRGKIVHNAACGMMDIEKQKPMQPDAIFRIASMTKPVTSVAAMLLYEEGRFDLHTPLYEFIPAFKDVKVLQRTTPEKDDLVNSVRPITIGHLMTHTSGLSYGWDPSDPVDQCYIAARSKLVEQKPDPDLEDIVDFVAAQPLAFEPGTSWRYSLGIDVLGRIVEIVSGKPLDEFFAERIFEPLRMVDSGFYAPEDKLPRLAVLYGHVSDKLTPVGAPAGLRGSEKPSWFSGGGGLVSTASDYARFASMLCNGGRLDGVQLLSPTTVALYRINHASDEALRTYRGLSDHNTGYGFGLGVQVLTDVAASGKAGSVGEFGWSGAFSTYFWIDPVETLYGVLMTQYTPNNIYPIWGQFKQLTYQAIIG